MVCHKLQHLVSRASVLIVAVVAVAVAMVVGVLLLVGVALSYQGRRRKNAQTRRDDGLIFDGLDEALNHNENHRS